MGSYLSSPHNTPDLPKDVVYSILSNIPVSDLIENARLVSKKWHQVGTSNAIWWPRYTTHLQNDPGFMKLVMENTHDTIIRQWLSHQQTQQSQWEEDRVFRSFLRIWNAWNHIWIQDGMISRARGMRHELLWIHIDGTTISIVNWDVTYENAVLRLGLFDSRQVTYSEIKGQWVTTPSLYGHGKGISIRQFSVIESDYPNMSLLITHHDTYQIFDGTTKVPERLVWVHNLDKTPHTLIQQRVCDYCKLENACYMCPKCKSKVYCGSSCQKRDWESSHFQQHGSDI